MHQHNLRAYQHLRNFHKVRFVVVITVVTMVFEIVVGWLSNSMALLSDGWHMGTHACALGITLFTYFIATQRQERDFTRQQF